MGGNAVNMQIMHVKIMAKTFEPMFDLGFQKGCFFLGLIDGLILIVRF